MPLDLDILWANRPCWFGLVDLFLARRPGFKLAARVVPGSAYRLGCVCSPVLDDSWLKQAEAASLGSPASRRSIRLLLGRGGSASGSISGTWMCSAFLPASRPLLNAWPLGLTAIGVGLLATEHQLHQLSPGHLSFSDEVSQAGVCHTTVFLAWLIYHHRFTQNSIHIHKR